MLKVHFANTKDTDMFYLVRKSIPDPFFYIHTGKQKLIFLNALEIDAFNEGNKNKKLRAVPLESLVKEMRTLKLKASPMKKLALVLFRKYKLLNKKVSVSKHFPLDMADFLRRRRAKLIAADQFLPERRTKTEREITLLRESTRRTCKAFELIEQVLRQSKIKGNKLLYKDNVLTSEFLKREVELLLFEQGLENSEGLIISCGKHAAMPHHGGAGPIRPHQTIVCDIFPRDRKNGYFADVTRTFLKGRPSKKVIEMYEAVKKAQDKALEKVKPGVQAADVHAAAAEVIKKAGFDAGEKGLPAGRQGFIHGLGHGVGLDVHESPSLSPYSKDVLEEGDVITIEPGLYYPKWGGVRLEDVVVVTKRGCENITGYTRKLIIA